MPSHQTEERLKKQGGSSQIYVTYRRAVQLLFFVTTVLIGYRFWLFVSQLEAGMIPTVERPPGVEAFLPISALLSVKQFFLTGVVNDVHPSGLLIFFFITLTALLLKKSFCSWVCPIGLVSELLGQVHARLFRNGLKPPKWADTPLRAVKYVLLGFFIWTIFIKMNILAVEQFIYSSFNVISDVKMLKFFTDISFTATVVIGVILVLTFVIRNFWCRYLCPYGAWLGLVSILSPYKIRRDETACVSCGKCSRACPGHIRVSRLKTVVSDECFACGKCIDTCPEKNALSLSLTRRRAALKPWIVALSVLLVFGAGSIGARLADKWQNRVTGKQYLYHMLAAGLIRTDRIKDMADFVNQLDFKGKRLFMMQMKKDLSDRGDTRSGQS